MSVLPWPSLNQSVLKTVSSFKTNWLRPVSTWTVSNPFSNAERRSVEIKTGTLGPTWDDYEKARMKREDDAVARRFSDPNYRPTYNDKRDERE